MSGNSQRSLARLAARAGQGAGRELEVGGSFRCQEKKAKTLKPKIAEMPSLRSFLRPPLRLGTGLAFSLQNRK